MRDKEIEPIVAGWHSGEQRSEAYRLLTAVHVMAGGLAKGNQLGWRLSKTCTEEKYIFTEWSNGIVNVGAETFKDHNGEVICHEYYLRAIEKEED